MIAIQIGEILSKVFTLLNVALIIYYANIPNSYKSNIINYRKYRTCAKDPSMHLTSK